jgi:hypothetical protein
MLAQHSLIIITNSLLLFGQLSSFTGSLPKRGTMYDDLFCFLSSFPILPQPPLQCLASICNLSTLHLHFMTGVGLPIHMIGEVSWAPKRRRVWTS